MDLLTMRNLVRGNLIEETQLFFSDVGINSWINQVYLKYAAIIMATKNQLFIAQAAIDFVANQNTYPLPADFKTEIRVNRIYNNLSTPLLRRHRLVQPVLLVGASTIYPTWDRYNNNIIFEPTPPFTETGAVILDYVSQPIRLVNDTDTPNAAFPDMYHDLIVNGATVMGLLKERDADSASMYAAITNDLEEVFRASFSLDEEPNYAINFFDAIRGEPYS